ncbi:bck1-like resistance to osmotic shock [Thecaphora frezii]
MTHSSQAPLISLPLKTTEEVDLGSVVKALIVSSYGEDPSAYAEQTSQLNRARQDAVRGAGSDSTARDLLYKWFHILEMLELRFPELRVPFPWKDAFTHKSISQSSLAYEKASIIFNIAATLSSLAASQPRLAGNPDGLKRAYASLRQAAGMLSYINENFLHAPSTDMSKDVVKTLVGILLAQASEVFLEKTIEEKKNSGLVAKLSSHTASAYAGLVEDSKEFVAKGYFDRSWTYLIQTKAKYFSSLTQYHRALADDAAGNHGSCLVRLTLSENHAKEAQKLSLVFNSSAPGSSSASRPSLPSDAASAMSALVNGHLAICTERKEAAVKDNDLIYHDILPSESTLPAVDKLIAATALSIQDIFAAPEVQRVIGPDLFQRLIPLGVHESASMYSEEKAKIARAETERHDLANGELQAALDYMGLPASLKKFRGIGKGAGGGAIDALADPGSEVMRWSEEEAEGGGGRNADGLGMGTDGVDSALDRIARLRGQAAAMIEAASAALDEENRECEKQRVKYGHRWTQDPAGLQTKEMRTSLKENREALQQAGANDQRIQELWNSIKGDVDMLVRGREALETAFAAAISGSASSSLYGALPSKEPLQRGGSLIDVGEDDEKQDAEEARQVEAKVQQIDELLIKLRKLQKDRGEVLSDLKEKIQTDDISQLLVLNRRSQNVEPAIFAAELEKFKAHQNRLAVSVHHQQVVVGEVTQAYQELRQLAAAQRLERAWADKERWRSALVAKLKRAKEGHAEVRAAVAKGLQFYNELGGLVEATRRNVEAYVGERKAEREKMAAELEWDDKLKGHEQPRTDLGAGGARAAVGASLSPVEALQGSFGNLGLGSAPSPLSASPVATRPNEPYPAPPPVPPQRQGSYASSPPPPLPSGPVGGNAGYASPPPLPPSLPSLSSSNYRAPPPPAPATASSPYDNMFNPSLGRSPFSDSVANPTSPLSAPTGGAGTAYYSSNQTSTLPPPPQPLQFQTIPSAVGSGVGSKYQMAPPPPPSLPSATTTTYVTGYGGVPPPPPHTQTHTQTQQYPCSQSQHGVYQPQAPAYGAQHQYQHPAPAGQFSNPPPHQHQQQQYGFQYGQQAYATPSYGHTQAQGQGQEYPAYRPPY